MTASVAPASPPAAPAAPPSPAAALLEVERQVLEFWAREKVPERALALHPDGPVFRFTEGPPTANGRPHVGHLMPRVLKDMGLRHQRMKGYRIISTMAGWDCHGLPVEVQEEKAHGWTNKKQILEYGVARFAADCRKSVMTYVDIWETFSRRMAFWLDYSHPYYTMDATNMESVWWSLQQLYQKGLLEKGHYVVPYCPRCETPEATHEVAQGYQETTDPSITLRLRLTGGPEGKERYLLVWTTTPWTLPSNLAVAVGEAIPYVAFEGADGAEYLMAAAALTRYFPKEPTRPKVLRQVMGSELVGLPYEPPFPGVVEGAAPRFRTYAAPFVSTEEGTGLVHIAPSFGVDDYQLGAKVGLGVFDPLDSSGRFTDQVPIVAGKWFKEADRHLLEDLSLRGLVWRKETFRHTYPFCWRCDRPLMYRALDTWFVRTHKIRDQLLANNAQVVWDPPHLKDGRFGNFVAEGKDWALSRNRYWGTPLPIWTCPKGHYVVVGSFAELGRIAARPLPQPFDPHLPTVDELAVTCPDHRVPMAREPYVIDTWYDAGAAPFAQFHYPLEKRPEYDPTQPLDYVAEAIDQTRGWFYTLLVIHTALFGRAPFKHVLCHGFALDDDGKKMSKSKGNVADPIYILEKMGSDPTRLAIYLAPYTEMIRFGEVSIRQTGLRMVSTLLNVLEFYRSNQREDRVPAARTRPKVSAALDRWLLSRLEATGQRVDGALEHYDAHEATIALEAFLQELSTWWLRRSRPRFWSEASSPEKRDAYDTLSFTLLTYAGLIAPLAPFLAEHLYQTVTGSEGAAGASSVHLEPFPSLAGARDEPLEESMRKLLGLVETARRLRSEAGVKSRMPLEELVVAGFDPKDRSALGEGLVPLLSEELNVKRVTFAETGAVDAKSHPVEQWVLGSSDKEPALQLALTRKPSRALYVEGLAREMVRRVQMTRKERRLQLGDRIRLELWAQGDLAEAARTHQGWISEECLVAAWELHEAPLPAESSSAVGNPAPRRWDDVEGGSFALQLAKA